MNLNFIRPAFVFLWLVVGLAILFRKPLGIEFFDTRWDSGDLTLGAIVAFAVAIWNGFRWWSARRIHSANTLPRNPLQPRDHARPFEYIPELDFTKPREEPPAK